MIIEDFTLDHISAAVPLIKANYEEERQQIKELPEVCDLPEMGELAGNGLGVAAFENDHMLGFLSCYGPFDNAFLTTGVRGVFSPLHAHAAVYQKRVLIYQCLYQAAAEKWVKQAIISHSVAIFAHDRQAVDSFFRYGFGMRCVDAIRPMQKIVCRPWPGLDLRELESERKCEILDLKNRLIAHLGQSPTFMAYPPITENGLNRHQSRFFTAFVAGQPAAFIEISDKGENFASYDQTMMNICGAYCLPEYRGRGVIQNLLNYLIFVLNKEGFTRLGVDFESFNPNAWAFWLKYFTAYTSGLVRRIDDLVLEPGFIDLT